MSRCLSNNLLYGFKAARSARRARPGSPPGLRSCLRPAPPPASPGRAPATSPQAAVKAGRWLGRPAPRLYGATLGRASTIGGPHRAHAGRPGTSPIRGPAYGPRSLAPSQLHPKAATSAESRASGYVISPQEHQQGATLTAHQTLEGTIIYERLNAWRRCDQDPRR